jgi:glycosyltransferase involved in cell wall biosynthesis
MKYKILYLTQLFPLPPHSGGRIKTLNTLKTLAKKYEVRLVCFAPQKPPLKELKEIRSLVSELTVFTLPNFHQSPQKNIRRLISYYLQGTPYFIYQYDHLTAKEKIKTIIQKFQPDVVHVDHLNMAYYLPDKKTCLWVYEEHNIESQLLLSRFIYSKKLTQKAYLFWETVFTYLFERKNVTKFDHTFALSTVDAKILTDHFRVKNISLQNVVYPPQKVTKRTAKKLSLLFIGNLEWPPNEDAVQWFSTQVFPLIQKKIPSLEFHIIGQKNDRLAALLENQKGISFHGQKTDLLPFLKTAQVFVLPFRMGGGVRVKALTALANQVPIVSTYLGVMGLQVKHRKECLIANDPLLFAQSINAVITSKKLQNQLRQNGKKHLLENHSEKENTRFLKNYAAIIKNVTEQK